MHFDLPADRQQVEGDGTTNDLLHIRADDGQLYHHPQNNTRYLQQQKQGDKMLIFVLRITEKYK